MHTIRLINTSRFWTGLSLLCLLLALQVTVLAEEPATAPPPVDVNRILGSKHDLTALNKRAGVEAMGGVAFSDYGNACIYCHIPPDKEDAELRPGQIAGWNRIRPISTNYNLYGSRSFDSAPSRPNDISLLCLSCHDGTMAVDRIIHPPNTWNSGEDMSLHMRLDASDDLNSCGKCHDGSVAHDISYKSIGTNLRDDHPISIRYAGLDLDIGGFRATDNPRGFDNGIRLFDGNIECATCHNVHNPDSPKLLRTDEEKICVTCHTN